MKAILETLPPIEGVAAQHSLHAYLQTRDWMLLQSMSLDPSGYGWTAGSNGHEPVPMLDPVVPEELLKFTSCNCKRDCSIQQCSCKKNDVKCISACGYCKGIACKNCIDDGEFGEDTDFDSDIDKLVLKKYFSFKNNNNNNEWVWSFHQFYQGVV